MFTCTIPVDEIGAIACAFYGPDSTAALCGEADGFFETSTDFSWGNSRLTTAALIGRMVDDEKAALGLVIRNPHALCDKSLRARLIEVAGDCDSRFGALRWAAACAEGVDARGVTRSALYFGDAPKFLWGTDPAPVASMAPDALMVNLRAIRDRRLKFDADGASFETAFPREGYRENLVTVFHPRFAMAATQRMEAHAPADALSDADAENFRRTVVAASKPVSISIVVRTIFNRRHLLKRLLVSLARARSPLFAIEVVLASDAPDAETAFLEIKTEHRHVPLRLARTPAGDEPSRNRNLRAGIAAARNDYVWIIDDDDYVDIFAFERLLPVFFGGARPLVFMTCDVMEEKWVVRANGDGVLAESKRLADYPAAAWREMFYGYNRIPICGCLAPTAFLRDRLDVVRLDHDLSEDYALHLMLLTAPKLPDIAEVPEPVAHISQRSEGENTMRMSDRAPWMRNITAYLSDLTYQTAAPGKFQMLAALGGRARNGKPL